MSGAKPQPAAHLAGRLSTGAPGRSRPAAALGARIDRFRNAAAARGRRFASSSARASFRASSAAPRAWQFQGAAVSYAATAWAYAVEGLSAAERSVLVYLGFRAADDGTCFPSLTTVAKATSLDRSTVKRAKKALIERGLVIVERRVVQHL